MAKPGITSTWTELHDYNDKPTSPYEKTLEAKGWSKISLILVDGALIFVPVLLMLKIGLVIYAEQLDQYNVGQYIDEASFLSRALVRLNAQLVTLFTLVFVVIVSTLVKRYALWKAQHVNGAYLCELEQLQGSISLTSTLKLVWKLRSWTRLSVYLVFIWSFYYIGSQSMEREYRISDHAGAYEHLRLAVQRADAPTIFDTDLLDKLQDNGYSLLESEVVPLMRHANYYLAQSIITNSQSYISSPVGTNNGPLIPVYDASVMKSEENANVINRVLHHYEGWIDVSKHSAYHYSNWQGLPLWGSWPEIDANGSDTNTTMIVPLLGSYTLQNTSYFDLDCTNITGPYPIEIFPNSNSTNDSVALVFPDASDGVPLDVNGYPLQQFQYFWRGLVLPDSDDINSDTTIPTVVIAALATCNLTMKYIDMQVQCLSAGCFPERIRWADNTNEYNATSYQTPFADDTFRQNFFSNMTQSTGTTDNFTYPALVQSRDAMGPAVFSLSDLPASDWFMNLRLAINTYYTQSQMAVTSQEAPNFAYLETNVADDFFTTVDMKGAVLEVKYRVFWEWIPLDFIACLVLLTAALASCWLRVHTVAPDVFGYVSSMTRGNPDFEQLGSAMDGYERTRELGRRLGPKRVRIGNVQEGEKGLISFGLAEAKHWHGLHRHKVYV